MSAHVLSNLLNELGKRDKMRGLPSILFLLRNELQILLNLISGSGVKTLYLCHYVCDVVMDVITLPVNL